MAGHKKDGTFKKKRGKKKPRRGNPFGGKKATPFTKKDGGSSHKK